MDITATLEGIVILSIEERIRIVQVILESISLDQSVPDLTIAQKQELDQCSKAYDVNPDDVMTREEVWKSIRGK
jgi:putative addiction module component (TIGR02574 family)